MMRRLIRENMGTLIYSIFTFAVYLQVSDSAYSCDQSIPTIAYVTSCPKNKIEWDIAAKRKNCESLAKIQTCTDEEKFQYHCLENQWQNMTLEICAPIFFLQGYCAKYNTEKKRVEENYATGFECLRFVEGDKCPSRYPSNEAYKYQGCYKLRDETPTQTNCPINISRSPSETTTLTKEELRNDNNDSIKTVFLVILALALVGVIVSFILYYKRKFLNLGRFFKENEDAEAGPEETGHGSEGREKTPLLSEETGPEKQDLDSDVKLTSPSNEIQGTDTAFASAPKSSDNISVSNSTSLEVTSSTRANNHLEKLNSDNGIDLNTQSGDVPILEQTSDIVTASKQERVNETYLKQSPDKVTASTKELDTFHHSTSNSDTTSVMKAKPDDRTPSKTKQFNVSFSQEKSDVCNTSKAKSEEKLTGTDSSHPDSSNGDRTVKSVSKEETASKSALNEAPYSEPMSNGVPSVDSTATSNSKSNILFSFNGTKKETENAVLDDANVNNAMPSSLHAEKSESLSDKYSPILPNTNIPDSEASKDGITSSNKISKNVVDSPKPILQYQSSFAGKLTSKDVPASKDAHVSTHYPAPDDGTSSKPKYSKPKSNEDTTPLALSDIDSTSNDNPVSKPISENNPFNEDTTPSEIGPADSEPISGKNPFDEDNAGDNTGPNDNNASKPTSGSNPFDEDVKRPGFRKSKRAPEPPQVTKENPDVTKINVQKKVKTQAPERPPRPGQSNKM